MYNSSVQSNLDGWNNQRKEIIEVQMEEFPSRILKVVKESWNEDISKKVEQ